MHRTGASSGSGGGSGEVSAPSAYVTAHPHPNVQRITTATVAGSRAPVWEHQCTTRIPNHYLQTQVHDIVRECVCVCVCECVDILPSIYACTHTLSCTNTHAHSHTIPYSFSPKVWSFKSGVGMVQPVVVGRSKARMAT
jgi:hypothetical protein